MSGERLYNGPVSVRPSVCLSVPSITSSSDEQLLCRAARVAEHNSERAASVL